MKYFKLFLYVIVIAAVSVAGYYYLTRKNKPAPAAAPTTTAMPKGAQVISPAGGEQWLAGSTHEIKWSGITKGTNVSINYQSPFGIGKIVATTKNTGSFNWAIPGTLKPSDKYYVIITTAGKDFDVAYSAAFAIVSSGSNSSQTSTSTPPGESPQTMPNPNQGSAEVTCLTLPPDYRADISVFPGGCLLQIIPITKNGTQSYAVFYEVAASGAEIMSFFDAGLAPKGWSPWAEYEKLITLPPGMAGHGFTKGNYGLAVGVENNPSGKIHYYIGYNISD